MNPAPAPTPPSSLALTLASADAPTAISQARQQFQQQIDYFRSKLNLPTKRWDDIQTAAHDKAFIVAGAQKADLLADLRAAVDKAVAGQSIGDFRKQFNAAVAKSGWTGWTGEGTTAGVAWRIRVIYQTNIATSYAAGRWAQLKDPELTAVRPYWRYIHNDSALKPRPHHKAWGDAGLTLRHDHPFWLTHFPPNGWGCHCSIQAVRAPKAGDSTTPPDGWHTADPKTGAPPGIDKGWAYAPGASAHRSMQDLIDAKLLKLDAPIGAAMWAVLRPVLMQQRLAKWQTVFDTTRQTMQAGANTVQVHTVAPVTVTDLAAHNVMLQNAAIWMRDTELLHALRDTKTSRGAALPDDVWRQLPQHLETAAPYLDTQDGSLIYAIDLSADIGKLVVRVNYNQKGRFEGERAKTVSNFIQTGGLVEPNNIALDARYTELKR